MSEVLEFDGETFVAPRDGKRLTVQLHAVRDILAGGEWHTLAALEASTGFPQASISARIRDLRKTKFGAYKVDRRYVSKGQWEYRINVD